MVLTGNKVKHLSLPYQKKYNSVHSIDSNFLVFHFLYYSVVINESKENFKTAFCCFSDIKKHWCVTSSIYFIRKIIFIFACLDKSMPMSF